MGMGFAPTSSGEPPCFTKPL